MRIERFSTPEKLYESTYETFKNAAYEAIRVRGIFNLAVSGGTTPIPFFEKLSQGRDPLLDWSKVNFFWVDERWVPPTHAQHNYGTAIKAGLKDLPANFFPFDTLETSPNVACAAYAAIIRNQLGSNPCFDLVILGAGADGHTASIFNYKEDEDKGHWVVTTVHPESQQIRLSLTLDLLCKSRQVLLLLLGKEKKERLQALETGTDRGTPISKVLQQAHNMIIKTDITRL